MIASRRRRPFRFRQTHSATADIIRHVDGHFETRPIRKREGLVKCNNRDRRLVSSAIASIGCPECIGFVIEQESDRAERFFAFLVFCFIFPKIANKRRIQ